MTIISHRGNLDGPKTELENNPSQIEKVLNMGFDCEIDVWHTNGCFFLGHDEPMYPVDKVFLQNERLWCHAKNLEALSFMIEDPSIHCFWHQNDDFTLTSKKYIWTLPNKNTLQKSIIVDNCIEWRLKNYKCFGVCTDYCLSKNELSF